MGIVASGMLALTPLASAEVAVPAQVTNSCTMSQSAPAVVQNLTNALLGLGVVIPITIQTQTGNCTGISSTTVTNTNSGNTTVTTVRNSISNSFNRNRFR